jgi:hypothetical protein
MGILDDAIREHLDLKRKHGARDSEIREIEDEALGSGALDAFTAGELLNDVSAAEAPARGVGAASTETPSGSELGAPTAGREEPTKLVEPEPMEAPPSMPEEAEPPPGRPEGGMPGEPDLGTDEPISPPEGLREIPGQERLEEPIPGQESLEELISEEEPFPEDTAAPAPGAREAAEGPSQSGAQLEPPPAPDREGALEPERALEPEPASEPEPTLEPDEPVHEPDSSVPEPPPPPPPGSEPPGRARGRVDVPTEEHPPPGDTGGLPPLAGGPEPGDEGAPYEEPLAGEEPLPAHQPPPEEPDAEGGPQLYDFETDEEAIQPEGAPPVGETDDDFAALGPAEEEAPYLEEERDAVEEPHAGAQPPEEAYEGGSLEREETYEEEEEDDLWFEKGPPQDFDFEDDR